MTVARGAEAVTRAFVLAGLLLAGCATEPVPRPACDEAITRAVTLYLRRIDALQVSINDAHWPVPVTATREGRKEVARLRVWVLAMTPATEFERCVRTAYAHALDYYDERIDFVATESRTLARVPRPPR